MTIPLDPDKELLTVEEAASYLGVQRSTIHTWASQKKIPSVEIGRRLLFHRDDLDRMRPTRLWPPPFLLS